MTLYHVYKYFCTTEEKFVFEKRDTTLSVPTQCINNNSHSIDADSCTLHKRGDVGIGPVGPTGPYKYTRNPMLFGTLLMYLAFALFINSITSVVLVGAIFTFMLTVVVKMEEKRLLNDFGNQYEEYRKKVSKFIPWFQRNNK
jgi:hypothetical protein